MSSTGQNGDVCEIDIGIGGMTCASCVARVERALNKVEGVQSASVNLATESARVVVQASDTAQARVARAVRDAGYEPRAKDAAVDAPDEGDVPRRVVLVPDHDELLVVGPAGANSHVQQHFCASALQLLTQVPVLGGEEARLVHV